MKKADGTQNEDCSTYRLNEKLKSDCTRIFQETAKLNEAMERATKNIVPKVSLPDTMRVIMNLLDTLAGAKFTGTVDTDAVKIRLPVERVSRAVRGGSGYSSP